MADVLLNNTTAATLAGGTISGGAAAPKFTADAALADRVVVGTGDNWTVDLKTSTLTNAATVVGGTGNDTIESGATAATVTGGAGADVFDVSDASANTMTTTISDYSLADGDKIVLNAGDVATVSATGVVGNGAVGGQAKITAVNNVYKYDAVVGTTTTRNYAAAVANANVDASAETTAVVMSDTGLAHVTLTGGTAADTINLSGTTSQVVLGAGNDTVNNYAATDSINLGNPSSIDDIALSGTANAAGNVLITGANGSLNLRNIATNATAALGTTTINGSAYNLSAGVGTVSAITAQLNDNLQNNAVKQAVIGNADVATTFTATFDAATTARTIDLNNLGLFGDINLYSNITNVTTAATQDVAILGKLGSENHLTYAGTGDATLWGGGNGSNTLTGGTTAGKSNDYLVYNNAGNTSNDTVSNFDVAYDNKIDLLNAGQYLASATNSAATTALTFTDGSTMTLEKGATGTGVNDNYAFNIGGTDVNVRLAYTGTAANFAYDTTSTDPVYFVGNTDTNDTITVSSTVATATENIFIGNQDNSNGRYYVSVENVNASTAAGSLVIAGNAEDNVIQAGTGNNTLYGGAGNDTLIGNAAATSTTDTFWYAETGNDVIASSKASDKVMLSWNSSDSATASIVNGDDLKISFNDGGSITVDNFTATAGAVNTFSFSDGDYRFNTTTNKLERTNA